MKKWSVLLWSGTRLLSLAAGGLPGDPASLVPAPPSSEAQSGADASGQADGLALYRQALQKLALQVEEGSFRCGYSVENDSGAYVLTTTGVMAVSHADGFRFSNQTQTESGGSVLLSNWFCGGGGRHPQPGLRRERPGPAGTPDPVLQLRPHRYGRGRRRKPVGHGY